jgi:hypothetical protein
MCDEAFHPTFYGFLFIPYLMSFSRKLHHLLSPTFFLKLLSHEATTNSFLLFYALSANVIALCIARKREASTSSFMENFSE